MQISTARGTGIPRHNTLGWKEALRMAVFLKKEYKGGCQNGPLSST